jgi:16S rRNA (guanine527-N7)-methyltransferase
MTGSIDALPNSQLKDILAPYGVDADDCLCEKIREYMATLAQWNSKVSLTTHTDPVEVLRFHFGESFFAVSKLDISKGRLADIGTGAGFPGIPIRMVCPALELLLIESNLKKAAFLSEVLRKMEISGSSVIRKRMGEVAANEAKEIDFVTARALGNYEDLLEWSRIHLSASGRVILWLGAAESAELSSLSGWIWDDPIKIPGSRSRFLVSASPTQ